MGADVTGYKSVFPFPAARKSGIFCWYKERKIVNLINSTVSLQDDIEEAAERKNEQHPPILEKHEEAVWENT